MGDRLIDDASTNTRPRVMFLSHDMLWPTVGGGRLRCENLLRRALSRYDIDLIIVAPASDVERYSCDVPEVDGLSVSIFADESRNTFGPSRASGGATDRIRELMDRHSYLAIHVEGSFLMPVIPLDIRHLAVVVEHNVESELLQQFVQLGREVPHEEIENNCRVEQDAWRSARAVIALCPEDAAIIKSREPTIVPVVIPNGWDHLSTRDVPAADDQEQLSRPQLLFLADFEYPPNRDATRWLVHDILPMIRAHVPEVRLSLAGINFDRQLQDVVVGTPNVTISGYVPAVQDELDQADIVVCPLRVGGGVKTKVIEALRRACLLVSTTTGGAGIPEVLRSGICFADSAEDFAAFVVRLCKNPPERRWRRMHLVANEGAAPTWGDAAQATFAVWLNGLQP